MPPKISAEMREAVRLAQAGLTAREAAKRAGVREESLYRNPSYREWRKTTNDKKLPTKAKNHPVTDG